jgi:hypothetical protein
LGALAPLDRRSKHPTILNRENISQRTFRIRYRTPQIFTQDHDLELLLRLDNRPSRSIRSRRNSSAISKTMVGSCAQRTRGELSAPNFPFVFSYDGTD